MQGNEDVVKLYYVRTFCVCGDGDRDVVVGVKGDIMVWKEWSSKKKNSKDGFVVVKAHDSYIYSLITICDNNNNSNSMYLLSASNDKKIKVWLYDDYSLVHTLTEHTSSVISLTYNNELHTLISSSADNTICIWLISFTQLITITKHKSILHTHIMFYATISTFPSTNNTLLITCGKSNTLYLYTSPSYTLHTTLQYHSSFIYSFIFNSTNNTIISISNDESFIIYSLTTNKIILQHKTPFKTPTSLTQLIHDHHPSIAVSYNNGEIAICNVSTLQITSIYKLQSECSIYIISYSSTTNSIYYTTLNGLSKWTNIYV
jgi:WD40 repeat protein